MPAAGENQPLHDLIQVANDPASISREQVIAIAYTEVWHSLAFAQTLPEQRLLAECFPSDVAVERFLEEHPRLAGRAHGVLGPESKQDPTGEFGKRYVATMVCGNAAPWEAERAFRRCWLWLMREVDKFEKLAPVERWRWVELKCRGEKEIPFLNEGLALVVYGEAAEQARLASTTFDRVADKVADGGCWIDRGLLGTLQEELRQAGYLASLHGPAAAFYDGRTERISHEERTAYAFAAWGVMHEQRMVRSDPILGKVLMALERLDNWRRGRGFQRLEDIFMRARHGWMAKRLDPAPGHRTVAVPDNLDAIRYRRRES